jgi:hypothetical protein
MEINKAGARIHWTPNPEWGEPQYSSGTVRHAVRGADGLTYAVNAGNTVIYVHSSRIAELEA